MLYGGIREGDAEIVGEIMQGRGGRDDLLSCGVVAVERPRAAGGEQAAAEDRRVRNAEARGACTVHQVVGSAVEQGQP